MARVSLTAWPSHSGHTGAEARAAPRYLAAWERASAAIHHLG
jgi:hypothetical protein